VDPHAVLGLAPGASAEEVQRAYRDLAKRFHPDRAGESTGELMISINAAYDLLRDQLAADGGRESVTAWSAHPAADGNGASAASRRVPLAGDWLPPRVRRVLARELLQALEPQEQVDEVVLTSTGDSHDVQLAVTDRRLLWLRDDAIMGRVRYLRYRDLRRVEQRPAGRLRRLGHLRVEAIGGRRLRFFELQPEVLERVGTAVAARAGS
jgi:hypothetical protein